MEALPNFVDMAKTPAEIAEDKAEIEEQKFVEPIYPYGLSICLTQEEIDKLDLDEDVAVGDYLHIHALAKVTSVSSREMSDGEADRRVEMTLTHIAAESEDEENEESEDAMPKNYMPGLKRPYK